MSGARPAKTGPDDTPRSVRRTRTKPGAADDRRRTVELTPATWPQFEALFEKHRGVWGGCWCLFYHRRPPESFRPGPQNRVVKRDAVRAGRSHGVLVLRGETAIGSCQFGPAAELPRIDGGRNYRAAAPPVHGPLWRIPCFFVDRDHRGRGVAEIALRGALNAIRERGGGVVEAYPVAVGNGRGSASLLWWGTVPLFERAGFRPVARLGKNQWLVRRTVRPRTVRPTTVTARTS